MVTTTTDRLLRADVFRRLPREQALLAYPDLENAYAAVDDLRRIARVGELAGTAAAQRVDIAIRNHVADRVQAGLSLENLEQARAETRLEVAYANLLVAAESKRTPTSKPYVLPEHDRARLAKAAEEAIAGRLPRVGLENKPAAARAHQIAREMSALDSPTRRNPFVAPELREIYHQDAYSRAAVEIDPELRGPWAR